VKEEDLEMEGDILEQESPELRHWKSVTRGIIAVIQKHCDMGGEDPEWEDMEEEETKEDETKMAEGVEGPNAALLDKALEWALPIPHYSGLGQEMEDLLDELQENALGLIQNNLEAASDSYKQRVAERVDELIRLNHYKADRGAVQAGCNALATLAETEMMIVSCN